MTAERLRAAAEKFRAVVAEADAHTVNGAVDDPRVRSLCVGHAEHLTMPRSVALAVADLLTVLSWFPSSADPTDMTAAIAVADAYLGATS